MTGILGRICFSASRYVISSPICVTIACNKVTMSTISDKIQIVMATSGETVPQALGRLRVALEDAFVRASRDLGLTEQQAELLCAAMRPAAVGDLARTLRCDRSNVSRLIDRAGARGLLTRRGDEEDGRVTVVELTPEGEGLARRF